MENNSLSKEDLILQKLEAQEKRIEEIYKSVEKTRKYFFWTAMISIALFVLPLIGLMFAIPTFLSTYTTGMEGL